MTGDTDLSTGKVEHILLTAICFLIVMPVLYVSRFADANSLTSWRWVFSETGFLTPFFLLIPAILGAYGLSRLRLRGPTAYAFLLILAAASIVPLWTEPEMIIDASRYFVQAKFLREFGTFYFLKEWGSSITAWTDMPLVPFLYGLLFSLLGESRIYIQAFNTLLFASTALLTCLIGKKLWDEETGVQAGLLLLGIPYLLMQVPLMLVDVPAMFFLTLSIYTFLSAVQQGGALRMTASALALCAAFFSKYSTWPMLLIIPMISIVFSKPDPKKVFARTVRILLLAGGLAGILIAVKADFFLDQMELLKTYQWSGLSRWQEGYASTFLFQTHPFITGLSLFGAYRAAREKDKRFLIPAWFVIVVILLRITRIRYIIPLFPLLVLMASYGLNEIRDNGTKKFITLCIAASSLVIACSAYLPFFKSTSMMNLKHAGEYLNSLGGSSVAVYALPQQSSSGSTFAVIPLLDYYTDKAIFCPQDWPTHPEADTRTSSLRFTWELKKPPFYSLREENLPVVVISDKAHHHVSGRFSEREINRFHLTSDVFKYQTVVTVYKDLIVPNGTNIPL